MNWFWMNVPLMALFFAAWTGIPLWLTFKHPDTGPAVAQEAMSLADDAAIVALLRPEAELVGSTRTS